MWQFIYITILYFSFIFFIQVVFIHFFIKTFAQWWRFFLMYVLVLFSNFNFAQGKGLKVFNIFFIKYFMYVHICTYTWVFNDIYHPITISYVLRDRKTKWCAFLLLINLSFQTRLFFTLFVDSGKAEMFRITLSGNVLMGHISTKKGNSSTT